MAEIFYHDSMTVEAGKTVFMHDSIDIFTTVVEDINNDIRTVPPQEELFDASNDFRMYGTFSIEDINNDFRFADYAINNLDNDFRMVGLIVRGDLTGDFRTIKQEAIDLTNTIRTVKIETEDINNNFSSCIEEIGNIFNSISTIKEEAKDSDNDFRTRKETYTNIDNDFRMLSSWQVPVSPELGFQSAGKTEVKVYINSAEQTDIDVDSISINQVPNGASSAMFNLGRAYDSSKPAVDSIVEIKYKDILLYKGYITEINPGDSPESIKINCLDEYWKLNRTKKYFFVGRKPVDTNEYYYETINEALQGLEFNYNIGKFIPQTMDLYGSGISEAITSLVQNSGNFSWFIKPDGTKVLWQGGTGNIVDLEPQELGKNLGLYQVIKHSITENVVNIINKLRVLMGNWTIRDSSEDIADGSGTKTYISIYHTRHEIYANPAWDYSLESVAKKSGTGFGYDYQDPNKDYKDVFRKFWLPSLDPTMESWTDRYPPLVEVRWGNYTGWTNLSEYMNEGFTVDYGFQVGYDYLIGASSFTRPSIIFSEPQVVYDLNTSGECYNARPKTVKLYLWKEHKVTYTIDPQIDPDSAPEEDLDNPLMFYTDKMGDYSETIIDVLNLPGLSKQEGYILKDDDGNIIENIPSWDDTEFARDYANWQLSKTCDKKITGSIDLTIDAMLYYNIDLSKRIKIQGIVDPINISSITYNFNNFTATLNVEKNRYYSRSVSLQPRGE